MQQLSREVREDLLARGFNRRMFGRVTTMVTAAAAMPFYSEHALAQLSGAAVLPPGAVKINGNESPYGPSKEALQAVYKAAAEGNRYQHNLAADFGKLVAEQEGVKPDYVQVFAGSSDPLHRTSLAFTSPTRSLVMGLPGYEPSAMVSKFVGAKVHMVPLTEFACPRCKSDGEGRSERRVVGYGVTAWDRAFRAKLNMPYAFHAHHQLMQSLSVGGLLGALGLIFYVSTLAFYSVKFARFTRGLAPALLTLILVRCISEVPLDVLTLLAGDFITHVALLHAAGGVGGHGQPSCPCTGRRPHPGLGLRARGPRIRARPFGGRRGQRSRRAGAWRHRPLRHAWSRPRRAARGPRPDSWLLGPDSPGPIPVHRPSRAGDPPPSVDRAGPAVRLRLMDRARPAAASGPWTEPGRQSASGSWTEPGRQSASGPWTEPGGSPASGPWTEPGRQPPPAHGPSLAGSTGSGPRTEPGRQPQAGPDPDGGQSRTSGSSRDSMTRWSPDPGLPGRFGQSGEQSLREPLADTTGNALGQSQQERKDIRLQQRAHQPQHQDERRGAREHDRRQANGSVRQRVRETVVDGCGGRHHDGCHERARPEQSAISNSVTFTALMVAMMITNARA